MRTIIGAVVSDKMQNTAVVKVDRLVSHPVYKKQYTQSKRYKAHNPDNKYKEGDLVEITESRPLSGGKRFVIARKLGTVLVREELEEDEVKEAAKIRDEAKPDETEPAAKEPKESKE